MITDFAAAFKQLHVSESEQACLGGQSLGGYFVYKVVCFGIKSGPLLWGRVAALLMRITAAIHTDSLVRQQCFVDDTAVTVGGPKDQRSKLMLRTLLAWLIFRTDLPWKKGTRGRDFEWIGARLRAWISSTGIHGVTVSITEDRIRKLHELCQEIRRSGELQEGYVELDLCLGNRVPRRKLRQFTGLATWISTLLPQFAAFTTMCGRQSPQVTPTQLR